VAEPPKVMVDGVFMKLDDLALGDAAFSESVEVLRMVFADLNDLNLIKKAFEIAEKQIVDEELGKLAITQAQKPENWGDV
jgi:hypothetical protein